MYPIYTCKPAGIPVTCTVYIPAAPRRHRAWSSSFRLLILVFPAVGHGELSTQLDIGILSVSTRQANSGTERKFEALDKDTQVSLERGCRVRFVLLSCIHRVGVIVQAREPLRGWGAVETFISVEHVRRRQFDWKISLSLLVENA